MSITFLIVMFFVAVAAGFINVVSGGGTFYTISYMQLLGYRIDNAQIHSDFLNPVSHTSSVIFFIAGISTKILFDMYFELGTGQR